MYKYAELYGGKVRDIKTSNLPYADFCSIWDPTAFWIDVTGIDNIEVGYVLKSDTSRGTYFEAPEDEPDTTTLEYAKSYKLELLKAEFERVQETATVTSSLGFVANAGTRAHRDVTGLIKRMKVDNDSTTEFRDYNDIFQVVTLAELEILQIEIIKNGQYIYKQKWDIEKLIESATNIEDVDAVVISFNMLDFFDIPYEG